MRGTFFGIEIGRTGLTTAQFGLDVTGHNIANLDTEGFTRQRIVSTAHDPYATIGRFAPTPGHMLVGGGVRVQILNQIRSAYLDRRFRTESTEHAYWETRSQSLSYIQSFFDNVNEATSINHTLGQFFGSLRITTEDPVSGAPRTLMQTTAMDLVQQFNSIYQGLIDFQTIENNAVEVKIGEVNRIAQHIVELNKAIYGFEITGLIANDLRDKRNLLLDDLASLIDIDYEEYPDPRAPEQSMLRIRIGGSVLLDHDWSNELSLGWMPNPLGTPPEERVAVPIWAGVMDVPMPEDSDNQDLWDAYELAVLLARLDFDRIKGGEIKAHMDMRDGMGGGVDTTKRGVPYYIEMMNNLARALVQEINGQHIQGWSDHPTGSETNILFFDALNLVHPDGTPVDLREFIVYYANPVAPGDDPLPFDPPIDVFDPDFDETTLDFHSKSLIIPPHILQQITAGNLKLNQAIIDNVFNIAASDTKIGRAGDDDSDPEKLQRGNNNNMLELHRLFGVTTIRIDMGDGDVREIGSFNDYATTIRFDVGNTLHTARQARETARILTLAAENQRTAIAGVSLDEEMVGLVRYNHAYNGAARVITAMDDALDRLINGTGRVGL
ncbi:MAG: flagellar hook-associated protein FlgK [Oscillospiraceae bacterium]|nr:flagellar hook-associated protein FlgK [Oscillospiraceae bacterium]